MTLTFVFLLLLDLPYLHGQQTVEEFDSILLRLTFPSVYNTYRKSCCKLYPGGCYPLMDNSGFTCDFLRDRVTKTESDGWIEFKISKVQIQDGGYYRCLVTEYIYNDYYVVITEATNHRSLSKPLRTTTVRAVKTSTSAPSSSTGSALTQVEHRSSWITGVPFIIIVSIFMMIVIAGVICIVCFKKKTKTKPEHSDEHGKTVCESLKQDAADTTSIVYTTLDFRAHRNPSAVYENFSKTRSGSPDTEHPDRVEYSTLAIHQKTSV